MASDHPPIYKVGEIPDLTAWTGDTLRFHIDAARQQGATQGATSVEIQTAHPPAGALYFNSQVGEFTYVPAADDKAPFEVTFLSHEGNETHSQVVRITPLPRLHSERHYITSCPQAPDPGSTLYIQSSVTPNKDGSENHLITGVKIIFDPAHSNNLHKRYSASHERKIPNQPAPGKTLRSLTLCADQLVIRGELFLPETSVRIFARELIFEDLTDSAGCINTTPLEYELKKAKDGQTAADLLHQGTPGEDGVNGRTAGDIAAYIRHLRLPKADDKDNVKDNGKRFIMRGGNGQNAGHGKSTTVNAIPQMPGVCGRGGNSGVLHFNRGIALDTQEGQEKEVQDLNRYLDNQAGIPGENGTLAGLPLLFRVVKTQVDDGPYAPESRTTAFVSKGLRDAFDKNGFPLGNNAFVTLADFCFCGFSVGLNDWAIPGQTYTVFDVIPLVNQFKIGPFRAAFDVGQLTAAFRDWLSDYITNTSQHGLREKWQRLFALYGPCIPGPNSVVLSEKDWCMYDFYHGDMERRAEDRWWIFDSETGNTWLLENMKGHPDLAYLYLVRRYTYIKQTSNCYIFRGGTQHCATIASREESAAAANLLDLGQLPQRLRDELKQRLHITLPQTVSLTLLRRNHLWRIVADNAEIVFQNFPAKKDSTELPRPMKIILLYSEPDIDPKLRLPGESAKPDLIEHANAWLQPQQLQTTLEFVRDAYLAEQRDETVNRLMEYQAALALPPVKETAWEKEEDQTLYFSVRTEVATLMHRLHSQLDYFGHPAGWAPLLSLQACLKLYKNELERALKTLILASWIERQAKQKADSTVAMDSAIENLNAEAATAAHQVEDAEKKIDHLHARVQSLARSLVKLKEDLEKRREELRKAAKKNLERHAWIDFAFKSFSAITSVIPVGQPALGAVGSLSKVVADMAAGDPLEHVGKVANILSDATSGYLDDKTREILKDAKESPDVLRKQENAASITHVSKNIGPALAQIGDAVSGLQVPQGEVEAELARLEASDPAFVELASRIRSLNTEKAELCSELNEAVQIIGTAYNRITANCLAMTRLDRQRGQTLAVLDHDALLYVREMAQRARQTLIKYLYIVMKSYESTLLEPLGSDKSNKVDFRLTRVFEKIEALLVDAGDIELTKLEEFASATRVLFEDNLAAIERSILDRYLWAGKERWANDPTPESRLSVENTPAIIDQLNTTGEAVIDLKHLGLIPPGYERMRIMHVEIIKDAKNKPEFDNPPREGTVRFVIDALGDGTLRSEGKLYAVRDSGQQICGWAYHFSDDSLELGEKSRSSIALLRELLEKKHGRPGDVDVDEYRIYDLLTPPPAWSRFRIRYDRSDIVAKNLTPPALKSMLLRWHFDVNAANPEHRVLDIRTFAPCTAMPLIECNRPDLGRNADGYGYLYRIYGKGSQVTLSAAREYGDLAFSHWRVYPEGAVATGESLENHEVTITLTYDTQVHCFYATKEDLQRLAIDAREARILATSPKSWTAGIARAPQELSVASTATESALSTILRNKPSATEGSCIGYLPRQAGYTVLEGPLTQNNVQWYKIDFRGLVGWTNQ